MAEVTLDRMAAGGIHDQLAGGFHRYAVDAIWLVPHFEKMLYDNALLARGYLAGLRGDRRAAARRGRRVDARLPRARAAPATRRLRVGDRRRHRRRRGLHVRLDAGTRCARCSATTPRSSRRSTASREEGNFEGATVLSRVIDAGRGERALGRARRAAARRCAARMLEARALRPQPGLDDKALASWNGMALAALAEGARVLGRADLLDAAERLRRVPARPALAPGRHALAHPPRRRAARSPASSTITRRSPRGSGSCIARRSTRAGSTRPAGSHCWPTRASRIPTEPAGATRRRTASSSSRGRARSTTHRRPRAPRRSPACSCASPGSTATTRSRRAPAPSWRRAGELPARAPQAFGNLLCVASSLLGDAVTVAIAGSSRRPRRPRARARGRRARRARGDRLDRPVAAPAGDGPAAYVCRGRTCLPPRQR